MPRPGAPVSERAALLASELIPGDTNALSAGMPQAFRVTGSRTTPERFCVPREHAQT